MVDRMIRIGTRLLFKGQVRTLQRKRSANTFHWAHVPKAELVNLIIIITKIPSTIVVLPLLRRRLSLNFNMKKKPFHQRKPKMPQLQLRQKEKEQEKAKMEKAKEKEKERKEKESIDKLRSVQSLWLSRPPCRCMVSID